MRSPLALGLDVRYGRRYGDDRSSGRSITLEIAWSLRTLLLYAKCFSEHSPKASRNTLWH